jgi:hypothetical protein
VALEGVGVVVEAPSQPGVEEPGADEGEQQPQATLATFRALTECFRPYRRTVLVIGFCLLLEAGFEAFLPISFSP